MYTHFGARPVKLEQNSHISGKPRWLWANPADFGKDLLMNALPKLKNKNVTAIRTTLFPVYDYFGPPITALFSPTLTRNQFGLWRYRCWPPSSWTAGSTRPAPPPRAMTSWPCSAPKTRSRNCPGNDDGNLDLATDYPFQLVLGRLFPTPNHGESRIRFSSFYAEDSIIGQEFIPFISKDSIILIWIIIHDVQASTIFN